MMCANADAIAVTTESRAGGPVPLFLHDDWQRRFPWLIAGTTGAGDDATFDLGLFGDNPVRTSMDRWHLLMDVTGARGAVHSRQVHGNLVSIHEQEHEGLLIGAGYDGHATSIERLLLTVSVADCVPLFLVDPEERAIALLHAGWRGVAADMLESGLAALAELAGSTPDRIWMHAGPAICGDCYEVGPEVHEALGLPRPPSNTTIDLRGVLARRATRGGVDPERISISGHCTRCGPGRFFSHRGGERGRQMGLLGIRSEAGPGDPAPGRAFAGPSAA